MKKWILVLTGLLFAVTGFSQMRSPVKWSFSAKKINASTYEVYMTAIIDEGWHIYSQTTPDGGPIPTTIDFSKNPLLTMQGPANEEGNLEQKHEPLFGVDVKQFSNKVVFVQTVKRRGNAKTSLNGTIEFMSCNDRECLPPAVQKFSIMIQ